MHQPAPRANTEKLEGRDGSPAWIQQVQCAEFPSSAAQHHNSSLEHADYFRGAFSLCFYSGLKCSRSPCTFSKCLGCRVCNSLYHRIHIWSTMSVSGGMQKLLLPLPDKHQHRWSRTTATNLSCMKVALGLICLSFLRNSLWDVFGYSGWAHLSLSWDAEEAQPFSTFVGVFPEQNQHTITKITEWLCGIPALFANTASHKAMPSGVSFPGRDGICQTLQSHRIGSASSADFPAPSPQWSGHAFLTQQSFLLPFWLLILTRPYWHHFSPLHLMENNEDQSW